MCVNTTCNCSSLIADTSMKAELELIVVPLLMVRLQYVSKLELTVVPLLLVWSQYSILDVKAGTNRSSLVAGMITIYVKAGTNRILLLLEVVQQIKKRIYPGTAFSFMLLNCPCIPSSTVVSKGMYSTVIDPRTITDWTYLYLNNTYRVLVAAATFVCD